MSAYSEVVIILKECDYIKTKASINGIDILFKIEGSICKVAVVLNNETKQIKSEINIEKIISQITRMQSIPRMEQHYLFFITNEKKSLFKRKDVVFLTFHNIKGTVSNEFKTEYQLVRQQKKIANIFRERISTLLETKNLFTPYMIYILIFINVFIYYILHKRLNTIENIYGISREAIVLQHQNYRLLTYMFLHSGIIHLLGNMLSLYFVGRLLEKRIGGINLMAIYIIGGIYGGICSVTLNSLFYNASLVTVGASGSIFAILGALMVEQVFNSNKRVASFLKVLFLDMIIVLSGFFRPNVDNMCHIGGFFAGIIVMCIIRSLNNIIDQKRFISLTKKLRKIQTRENYES